jgi:beta-xylosidase
MNNKQKKSAFGRALRFLVCICITLALFGEQFVAGDSMTAPENEMYKNPVLFADYSDPDIVRAGDDFYMVASSFSCMPGIPVLHSKDLVSWEIIGHVYDRLPFQKYDKPAHGEGAWAPSIRFHNGLFYVYFCTPHEGLFMASAKDPAGPWQMQQLVSVELWEDPCPFWDDDGNAYLVRSKLRGGILYLHRMSADGTKLLDNGAVIFDDQQNQPIIEGPKLLKKDGYYYIFAPAGGVSQGWQCALRSKNIYGPYEQKTVLHQGSTDINGPHQGGIVQLKSGQWWFLNFQDKGPYGRIVHLQPVQWKDNWPLIGVDNNNDGIGEPVTQYDKPDVGQSFRATSPQTSDEFDSGTLSLQWQWHANPKQSWFSLTKNPGSLRLYCVTNPTQEGNLWFAPNLLLQKFPAPAFTVTTKITFASDKPGERAGLVIMGKQWAYLALTKTQNGLQLGMFEGAYDRADDGTKLIDAVDLAQQDCFLRVRVQDSAICTFFYSLTGNDYKPIGKTFTAAAGVWIGAKVGLFSINPNITDSSGYADFDFFRFE